MPDRLDISAPDQVLSADADASLLALHAAVPAGLYPPFPPLELPGGLGGLIERGGFGQTFFFGSEVLGLTFISPSGRRIVAGGRTVKNVQGYDLTRPFVGSFGGLGRAERVTLRLRPGLASAHHVRPGRLADLPEGRARFVWQHGGELHAYHFGHPREVEAVMELFGGTPVAAPPDYRADFPNGMGVGEAGPLQDRRFGWADGGRVPDMPALFAKLVAAL